jgi:hypothetical protein
VGAAVSDSVPSLFENTPPAWTAVVELFAAAERGQFASDGAKNIDADLNRIAARAHRAALDGMAALRLNDIERSRFWRYAVFYADRKYPNAEWRQWW